MVCEDTQFTWLAYQDGNTSRLSSGNPWNYFAMRANSVYDPDPLLASGGISGFSEWGAFYRTYRVLDVEIRWTVANVTGNQPISVFALLSSVATPATTYAGLVNLSENSMATPVRTISQVGGMDRTTITARWSLWKLMGQQQLTDTSYTGFLGTGASNPAIIINIYFCAYTQTALTNPIFSDLKIYFKVQLTDRQTLSG